MMPCVVSTSKKIQCYRSGCEFIDSTTAWGGGGGGGGYEGSEFQCLCGPDTSNIPFLPYQEKEKIFHTTVSIGIMKA